MNAADQQLLRDLIAASEERLFKRLSKAGMVRDDRLLLTPGEAAAQLAISEKSVRDLINSPRGRAPRLASVIIGDGARRIEQSAIDAYVEERRREAAEAEAKRAGNVLPHEDEGIS